MIRYTLLCDIFYKHTDKYHTTAHDLIIHFFKDSFITTPLKKPKKLFKIKYLAKIENQNTDC